jgi:hypothetical protein
MDFLDYDGVSITIKLTTLQCIVVLPNSHSINKTTCDPACSKTVSDEDDSADVQNLLCPKLSEELVGLTQHVSCIRLSFLQCLTSRLLQAITKCSKNCN